MIRLEIVSVKLMVSVVKYFKHYPCTYCSLQGSCFICSNIQIIYFTIRITSLKEFNSGDD